MDQVNFFKCLSDETRLNIVTLVAENKELCVCDLTEKLQLSQPKISRHLALSIDLIFNPTHVTREGRNGESLVFMIHM